MRGQATFIPNGGRPRVIGNLQQTPDELKALIKTGDWNQVHLIARGSTIIQILERRRHEHGGRRGPAEPSARRPDRLQMHVGPPMTVEFRNIWLKSL